MCLKYSIHVNIRWRGKCRQLQSGSSLFVQALVCNWHYGESRREVSMLHLLTKAYQPQECIKAIRERQKWLASLTEVFRYVAVSLWNLWLCLRRHWNTSASILFRCDLPSMPLHITGFDWHRTIFVCIRARWQHKSCSRFPISYCIRPWISEGIRIDSVIPWTFHAGRRLTGSLLCKADHVQRLQIHTNALKFVSLT